MENNRQRGTIRWGVLAALVLLKIVIALWVGAGMALLPLLGTASILVHSGNTATRVLLACATLACDFSIAYSLYAFFGKSSRTR